MPSPKTKPQPLSDTEIEQIVRDIADGHAPMVWFTPAAVGVSAGKSGKVISLGDPSDGDFLQVRPTGSKDVLSFAPTEVTLAKPARATSAVGAASKTTGAAKTTSLTRKDSTVTQPSTLTPAAPPSASPSAGAPQSTAATPATPSPATAAKPAAKTAAARKAKTPDVTVTLTGTADGEWTVDVVSGKKRTVRALPVSTSAAAQAAKVLHPEVAEVVDGILDAARGVQQAKVAALQAELESARKLLEELSD